jgi:hypothetical protein
VIGDLLAGLDVRDSDVLALARLLRQSGSLGTAERLERAYDVETKLLGLTLAERDQILRVLEDASAGLATLRGQLVRDRERWMRDGLV